MKKHKTIEDTEIFLDKSNPQRWDHCDADFKSEKDWKFTLLKHTKRKHHQFLKRSWELLHKRSSCSTLPQLGSAWKRLKKILLFLLLKRNKLPLTRTPLFPLSPVQGLRQIQEADIEKLVCTEWRKFWGQQLPAALLFAQQNSEVEYSVK